MAVWTDKFSFLGGVLASSSFAFLALSDDSIDSKEIPHSQLIFWQAGKWGNSGQVNFAVVGTSFCTEPARQIINVGPFGEAFLAGGGDLHEEHIRSSDQSPSQRGMLRSVRGIGGKAFAVGMQRQVYRRDGRDLWTSIDNEMRPAAGQVVGFESIDGFVDSDIYAVGWEGEIWHYDGQRWRQQGSPTNFILTDVCCAADGNVYACGRVGMLLTGRNDKWRVVEDSTMKHDIWSLAWFDGQLYAATYRGLYRLERERFVEVDFGQDRPKTFYKLTATKEVMWSIGAKDIFAFDGNSWTRIE